jgi:Ankyrin repeats (3 copies)
MATTGAPKRSAANSSSPLLDPGILEHVLSYVGRGHHLFVAPVSQWWKDLYSTVERQQLTGHDKYGDEFVVLCDPQMTLYSSVLASPSRLKLAHATGVDCRSAAFHRAAGRHADLATLAMAHELSVELPEATAIAAAQCNKLANVQYLHSRGCPWTAGLVREAAGGGHFELLRWCCEHGCPWENDIRTQYSAAESGNVELMAWMLQQQPRTQPAQVVMYAAASKGHRAMCEFLHAQQCPWDFSATYCAAVSGHTDLLRWLVDSGCPWDAVQLCEAAAQGGSVEVLVYLQQQLGLPTSAARLRDMLYYAGLLGKLAAAKWLREQGAEWLTWVYGVVKR